MVLEAVRFQMSRKENAFNEWMTTTAEQHQRDGLDEEALKVGFKAGFTRGALQDERGDGHVVRDSGYDKGKQDGRTEASGGKGGSGSGARYDEGIRDGHAEAASRGSGGGSGGVKRAKDDLTMDRSDFSGRGGGVKVLKKGDAGHGGGKNKKKRRRY